MGNLVGSRVAGIHADHTVRKWLDKRGFRRPEDRLYATLLGALFVMPASLLIAGWLIQTGQVVVRSQEPIEFAMTDTSSLAQCWGYGTPFGFLVLQWSRFNAGFNTIERLSRRC